MSGEPRDRAMPDSPGVPATYVAHRAPDVLELDMGDGLILYDHASSLVHHLSPSASLIWQVLDGEASVERLAEELSEELGLDRDVVHRHISSLVAELEALGLVHDGIGRQAVPTAAASSGASRSGASREGD